MREILFNNPLTQTTITVAGPDCEALEAYVKVDGQRFPARLDADDVDRLLAVREHAVNPVLDIADFFTDVEGWRGLQSQRAAAAFVDVAGALAEAFGL